VAIYHLSVKSVSRSQGHSAVAAAAYRSGERIACTRSEQVHDYQKRRGVEHAEIIVPAIASWARDRATLWNQAEASETRKNSVVAREYEVALPHELSAQQRVELVRDFASWLMDRYCVAVDCAIHAPHRSKALGGQDQDNRNWHAHILTSTRCITSEGFGAKTRCLDAKDTRGQEVTAIREMWASLTNGALERARVNERVDHRSLQAQRQEALAEAQRHSQEGAVVEAVLAEARAAALDRPVAPHAGKAVTAMERKAQQQAAQQNEPYQPVTDRGLRVARAIQAKADAEKALADAFAAMRMALTAWVQETRAWIIQIRERAREIARREELACENERSPEPAPRGRSLDLAAMRARLSASIDAKQQQVRAKTLERQREITLSRDRGRSPGDD